MKRWSIVAAAALTLVVAVWMHGYSAGLARITLSTDDAFRSAYHAKDLLHQSNQTLERVLVALWEIDSQLVDSILKTPFLLSGVTP